MRGSPKSSSWGPARRWPVQAAANGTEKRRCRVGFRSSRDIGGSDLHESGVGRVLVLLVVLLEHRLGALHVSGDGLELLVDVLDGCAVVHRGGLAAVQVGCHLAGLGQERALLLQLADFLDHLLLLGKGHRGGTLRHLHSAAAAAAVAELGRVSAAASATGGQVTTVRVPFLLYQSQKALPLLPVAGQHGVAQLGRRLTSRALILRSISSTLLYLVCDLRSLISDIFKGGCSGGSRGLVRLGLAVRLVAPTEKKTC